MLSLEKIKQFNEVILQKLSIYLNNHADFIEASIIDELVNECHLTVKEAFALVLAEVCGLDIENNYEDRVLYENYFLDMLEILSPEVYEENPYYKYIKVPQVKNKKWEFKKQSYKPYEAFVYNDLKVMSDGRVLPQIGFFETEFFYPAVLENRREWMLITPNEIETMKEVVSAARGKVLTYGLGLGYYTYMVSEKENVSSITVVEKDRAVIDLFKEYILPQFAHKEKVNIIEEDAFTYAEKYMPSEEYDFVFADIWHDPSDGIEPYLKMKDYEKLSPKSEYMYWIEKTMSYYLEEKN